MANTDLDTLREYVDQEFENVEHQLNCLNAWKNHESSNDPVCLKSVLGTDISRIQQNINVYRGWKYADNERYNCLRHSKKNDPSQIVEGECFEIKYLPVTLKQVHFEFASLGSKGFRE